MKTAKNLQAMPVDKLVPYAKNARTHSREQIAQLAASIKRFGFTNPVLIDGDGGIIAGHGRVLAAQKLKMKTVPTLTVDHMTDDEKRAYILADNRLALNAGWDEDFLALELKALSDVGFDLDLVGFSGAELEALLAGGSEGVTDQDEIPETPKVPISRLGDVWQLGDHLVRCGDSCSLEEVKALLDGRKADMVFIDPPYNVAYGSNATNPKYKARSIKNDDMTPAEWDQFVRAYLASIFAFCDGNLYICMSDQELGHLQVTFQAMGGKWGSFITWVKDRFVIGTKDYHSRKEQILYGWKDGVKGRQRVEDRTQDDVWEIARPSSSEEHPTMKPVELVERALVNSSLPGQIVLDLFGGSGSTLIACEKIGRKARLMELDPVFVDVIVRRWQNYTERKAVHAQTGQTFEELKNERQSQKGVNPE